MRPAVVVLTSQNICAIPCPEDATMTKTTFSPVVLRLAQPGSELPPEVMAAEEELERLGDRIAELAARIQAATYELLVLIREFDERAGWNFGFRSCAH